MLIVQNPLAFALGPLPVGIASDWMAPSMGQESLHFALALMLVAPVTASLMLWPGQRRIAAA